MSLVKKINVFNGWTPLKGFNFSVWGSPLDDEQQELLRVSLCGIDTSMDKIQGNSYLILTVRLFEDMKLDLAQILAMDTLKVELHGSKSNAPVIAYMKYTDINVQIGGLGLMDYRSESADTHLKFLVTYNEIRFAYPKKKTKGNVVALNG